MDCVRFGCWNEFQASVEYSDLWSCQNFVAEVYYQVWCRNCFCYFVPQSFVIPFVVLFFEFFVIGSFLFESISEYA